MPVQHCQLNGKPGFQWGPEGHCYVYDQKSKASMQIARTKAENQGKAAHAAGYAAMKISFDYDGVADTAKGKELIQKLLDEGNTIYIVTARNNKPEYDIVPESRIYATGSNKAKIEKILELEIDTHYDNNPDVVKELGAKGKLFE